MRRNGLLVGGWAMATLLALVLGLQGIQSVSNSVTDHRPAPLSPASVRAALQRTSPSTSTTIAASPSNASSASSDDSTGSVLSSDVVAPSVNGDDGSTASDGAAPSANGSSSSSSPSSTPSSSTSGSSQGSTSSSTSSESSPPTIDRIYELEGGSVAVHFEDGAAHLVWARPNTDFSIEQAQDNGGTVDVRFGNPEHESRLRAYWDDGPRDEIEENQRSGRD